MENDSFLSIENITEGLYKDKGSRFLSFAFPVETEEEINLILEDLRKQYHDARHHCYAWRLGSEMEKFRANDDGEPSNSAGKPILGQIQAFKLTNILVVVIRYFGGTLLGVGGLIRAYKSASQEALQKARIIRQFVYASYLLQFVYSDINMVMQVIKDLRLEQWDQKFELDCELKVKVKKSEEQTFLDSFRTDSPVKLILLSDV